MKNFISKLVAFLFCVSFLNAQNHLSEHNIKGKVKSIIETSYRAVQTENEISKGDFRHKTKTRYNDKGKIIEKITLDENDNIIEKTKYSYLKDGKVNFKTFDAKGKLIDSNYYYSNSWIQAYNPNKKETFFDDKRNNYKTVYYDEDGKFKSAYYNDFTYDDKDNWIKEIHYTQEANQKRKPELITERVIEYAE